MSKFNFSALFLRLTAVVSPKTLNLNACMASTAFY